MKKSNKIIIIAFSLLVLDLSLTIYFLKNYYYLVDEGNPFILVGNGVLVLVINVIYLVLIIILSKVMDKYKTVYINSNNIFIYIKNLYKSDHYKFIYTSIIFSFIYATLISRLVVVIDWIVFGIYKGAFFTTSYFKIRDMLPLNRYDVIVGLLFFFALIPTWYLLEFKKVKNKYNDE